MSLVLRDLWDTESEWEEPLRIPLVGAAEVFPGYAEFEFEGPV